VIRGWAPSIFLLAATQCREIDWFLCGLGLIGLSIVCRNKAILDMRVSLGMARNAIEDDFCFVPQKVLFSFLECQNQV
jgi:hypothetical protein